MFCKSDGTIIFVAFPFATFSSDSRLFKVRTDLSAPASFNSFIASALPSAAFTTASFSASAFKIALCFLPSAIKILDFFSRYVILKI